MTKEAFRKYTNLPVLLNILNTKKITLSDPANWEDKNDSQFIEVFKRTNNYKTVLASCFSESEETYHHWKIYAGSISGICIEFNDNILLQRSSLPNVKVGAVEYHEIKWLEENFNNYSPEKLPFYKRQPFIHEDEWRIIYYSKDQKQDTYDIGIDIKTITKIIISPWLDLLLAKNLAEIIHTFDDTSDIEVYRSTLLENERWLKIARDYEDSLKK
jgi:hypothetical protein